MTMQSNQQNLSWARSFSPVAESGPYPMTISSPTRQQGQRHQQEQAQSQSSLGNSPSPYDYYTQGGSVLAHETPSFYPSPSYSTDRNANFSMVPPTSSSSPPSTTVSTGRHLDPFQGVPSLCDMTGSPPYCSAGDSNSGSHSAGMRAFYPLLTSSTNIARPTARKARAPYQRRQHTTTTTASTENTDNTGSSHNSTALGDSGGVVPTTASYHCQHPGCGKSFTRPYNLTSHMRTHTSERPFACSQCDRRFARQHDRNRHEKLHWNIKPHICPNCSKMFARMDALNRHLKVENGCGSILAASSRSV